MATRSARTKLTPVESSEEAPPLDIVALIGKAGNIDQAVCATPAISDSQPVEFSCLVSSGEMMLLEITNALGSTQSSISQHLGILRACGMINSRKQTAGVLYGIDEKRIVKMISATRDFFGGV